MDKKMVLQKIDKLIMQGDALFGTLHKVNSEILGTREFVDNEQFQIWKEEINHFLTSSSQFKSCLESFNKKSPFLSNYGYAKTFKHILIALKNSIEDNTLILDEKAQSTGGKGSIFIAHGRSNLWNEVVRMLRDDCNLDCINYFEKDSRVGRFIGDILGDFKTETSFAIVVMTAEDETKDDKTRARQNVIHEIGFFQGKLGFEKVAILKQKQVESFTNIDGLQYIEFDGTNIQQTFYSLQRMLKREGII